MTAKVLESAGGVGVAVGALLSARQFFSAAKWHAPAIFVSGVAGAYVGARIVGWRLFENGTSLQVAAARVFDQSQNQSILGAIVVGIATTCVYCGVLGIRAGPVLDAGSPGVAVAIGIGRVACMKLGCCYGRPTTAPWGVVTMPWTPAGYQFGIARIHPTAAYELVLDLALAILLAVVGRRGVRTWVVTAVFLIGYGLIRGSLQFFRGDVALGSTNFWAIVAISAAFVLAGFGLAIVAYRTSPVTREEWR